jgi:hypothetical protein
MKTVLTLLLVISAVSRPDAAPRLPADYKANGELINVPYCGYFNDPFLELICDEFEG